MMIVTAWDHAFFDALDAAERWQLIEDYRGAEPDSAIGRYRGVDDLLERICQQVHAAMWVPGFDAQAWALLHHGGQPTCQEGLEGCGLAADVAALARLRALTLEVGWWPVFDHRDPDPFTLGRVITVSQAGAFYSAQTGCQACAGPAVASAAPVSVHRDAGQAPDAPAPGPLHALVLDVRDHTGHTAGHAGHIVGRP